MKTEAMMLILNEKKFAEYCLNNKTLGKEPYMALMILAKYYYYCHDLRQKKIILEITDFAERYFPQYKSDYTYWNDIIERVARGAKKTPLFESDGVWITEKELAAIKSIKNNGLERLAFTLLCIAKLNQLKNAKSNGWVNADIKDVFTMARISCNATERFMKLNLLSNLGLLEFPKKNDNLNCRVTFIDNAGKPALLVDDFRELGYAYMKYCGENIIKCKRCGVLMRNNKNGTKLYCSSCQGYVPMNFKKIVCADCGAEFEVPGSSKKVTRCPMCQMRRNRRNMMANRAERYYKEIINHECERLIPSLKDGCSIYIPPSGFSSGEIRQMEKSPEDIINSIYNGDYTMADFVGKCLRTSISDSDLDENDYKILANTIRRIRV